MALAIVNKLLHGPTTRLKAAVAAGDAGLPAAAERLFGLEGEPAAPAARAGEAPASEPTPQAGGPSAPARMGS